MTKTWRGLVKVKLLHREGAVKDLVDPGRGVANTVFGRQRAATNSR